MALVVLARGQIMWTQKQATGSLLYRATRSRLCRCSS